MAKRILATDLATLTRCEREVYLNHHGDSARRVARSEYQLWLSDRGRQYEQQVLETFEFKQPPYTYENLELGAEITLEFMKQGVNAIAQGVLIDGDLVGIPDLLERVEGASRLGGYHYRPVDIKSASSVSETHELQVMAYCALLESIQGIRPDGLLLMRYPPQERTDDALYRAQPVVFDEERFGQALAEVQRLAGGDEPRPFFSAICPDCVWREVCVPMVETAQDVSLIPGLKRAVWRALHEREIGTLAALAQLQPADILDIKGVGEKTAPDYIRKARALAGQEMIRLGAPNIPAGPAIIFDIESVPSEGVFYLFGTLVGEGVDFRYEPHIANRPEDEAATWTAFVQRVSTVPGAIVHYGGYERTVVKKLGERYAMEDQAAALLDRMVDLEKTVKDAVVLPLRSASLKAVAPWIGFTWDSEVEGGDHAMLEYLRWLEDGQQEHLQRVLRYNEQDCRATLAVLDWLRKLV